MTGEAVVALALSIVVLAYLLYSMLRPEDF